MTDSESQGTWDEPASQGTDRPQGDGGKKPHIYTLNHKQAKRKKKLQIKIGKTTPLRGIWQDDTLAGRLPPPQPLQRHSSAGDKPTVALRVLPFWGILGVLDLPGQQSPTRKVPESSCRGRHLCCCSAQRCQPAKGRHFYLLNTLSILFSDPPSHILLLFLLNELTFHAVLILWSISLCCLG